MRALIARCILSGLVGLTCFSGAAQAGAPPAEKRTMPYSGQVAACADDGILAHIQARFAQKESEYWHTNLSILSFDKIHQTGFRGEGREFIPRRYCAARVQLSNKHKVEVFYQIGEKLGMIGFGDGVDFCVSGLDRNWAYQPACRVVRR